MTTSVIQQKGPPILKGDSRVSQKWDEPLDPTILKQRDRKHALKSMPTQIPAQSNVTRTQVKDEETRCRFEKLPNGWRGIFSRIWTPKIAKTVFILLASL